MIISASYKTDIPAFYGDWFLKRLNVGYCKVRNPYGGKPSTVSLQRPDVDGFVFWTKNLGPFLDKLSIVHDRSYPFVVLYTITQYPRCLEPAVVSTSTAVVHMQTIASLYGPEVAVWRYDPIVFTSQTPFDWHVENFRQLAQSLRGATNEVITSYVNFYDKTIKNLSLAAEQFQFSWTRPLEEEKRKLIRELFRLAKETGMRLTLCCHPEYEDEVQGARCADTARFARVTGQSVNAKLRPKRKGCGCYESRDIGDYNTCAHGCVYCYAVRNRELAQQRHKIHDPTWEFLYEAGTGTALVTPK